MTTKEVLKMYDIEMIKTNHIYKGKVKMFLGGGNMEAFFGLSYATADTINEDVLPMIEHFLNGNMPPVDPDLGGLGAPATIYSEAIRFHNPNTREIEQTVPIDHFKIIALAWRDFLL